MPALQYQTAVPAPGPKTGRNGIALKPPAIQFSAEPEVVQRLENHNGWNWSHNDRFATNGGTSIGAADNELPALAGVNWDANGTTSYTREPEQIDEEEEEVELNLYRPRWTAGNALVSVPKDCITTAELVAAWLTEQDPEVVGQVKVSPTIAPAGLLTTVAPGDILFHTHSDDDGDFHGAAVIATDGGDVITMEADASAGNIASMYPLFDMYEGHAGFRESQLQMETDDHSHADESTYVIKFSQVGGRSTATKLWEGIQEEIDNHNYTVAGQAAAESIKNIIQAEINDSSSDEE